jgi:4-coumarate--CoA ligase
MFHAACVPGKYHIVHHCTLQLRLLVVAHTTPLKAGHISYVMRRFDLEKFLSTISQYKINEVGIVPPIFVALVMSPATTKYDLSSLKTVSCGAAPLSKETQARFRKLLPKDTRVNQVWGMTESMLL